MAGVAKSRLTQERRQWRKDKPFGFVARPEKSEDGSINMLRWTCRIPGKPNTDWEDGFYPLTLEFSEEYPCKPPRCRFPQGFFHPNIYPSGTVCLSIINEDEGWRPSITVKQILQGIQDLLENPNVQSPAQSEAFLTFTNDKVKYKTIVREQARKYPPPE